MEEKLTEWGFSEYIAKFQDEEITLNILLNMGEATLSAVVPKAGPRSRLLNQIAEFRKLPSVSSRSEVSEELELQCESHDPSTSTPATPSSHNSTMDFAFTSTSTSTPATPTTSANGIKVDLRGILSTYAVGPALMKCNVLDAYKRRELVDVLADHLVVKFGRPSRMTYEAYSEAIVALFPAENSATYFIPSKNHSTPAGKLYFKVVNTNHKRRKLGDDRKACKADKSVLSDLSNLTELDDETEDAVELMTTWLQTHNRPESQLIDYWRKTAKVRLSFIHGEVPPPMAEICRQWPRYKDKDGRVLISQDFSVLFPVATDKITMVWPQMYGKVLDRLRQRQVKDKVIQTLLQSLNCNSDQPRTAEVEMALALRFLPLLLSEAPLPVAVPGKRKRNNWRPTQLETLQHFVDVQENLEDLKGLLEAKADSLAKKGYQLQPHVVVLVSGDGLDGPHTPYACIHSTVFFETTTVLEAVDVALKSAFVLGVQYPAPANASWTFLQKAVYDVSSKFDRVPSKVLELVTDLCG